MQAPISTGERTRLPSGREMAMRSALLSGDLDALDAAVQNEQPVCSQLEKILYCESEEEALKIIQQSGCDISAGLPNHSYQTLVHLTISMDRLNITRLLLENGADIDAKDKFGFTPLHVAVQKDKYEAACMLLCYGASANEQDFVVKGTPLSHAIISDHGPKFAELLIDYESDVKAINFFGETILHLAMLNNSQLLPKILALYEDVNDIEDIFEFIQETLCDLQRRSTEDCYLFKHVLSHVNEDKLIQEYPTILNDLICASIEHKEDFMECFYLVLSLDPLNCVSRLVEECSFIPLIKKFDFYKVNQSDRMSCLYSLLAAGKDIDYDEFNRIYWQYGFNEELEAIFKTRPHINANTSQVVPHSNYDCIDMASIIFYNYRVVTNGQILLTLIQTINQAVVKDYLRFFRIRNAHDISNPLDLPERVQKLVRKLKEQSVPSLREMSRNLIRETIISNSPQYDTPSCTCMYDVYDAIKDLPVPNVIQDILHLKRPLYI